MGALRGGGDPVQEGRGGLRAHEARSRKGLPGPRAALATFLAHDARQGAVWASPAPPGPAGSVKVAARSFPSTRPRGALCCSGLGADAGWGVGPLPLSGGWTGLEGNQRWARTPRAPAGGLGPLAGPTLVFPAEGVGGGPRLRPSENLGFPVMRETGWEWGWRGGASPGTAPGHTELTGGDVPGCCLGAEREEAGPAGATRPPGACSFLVSVLVTTPVTPI